ncbi:MAG: hypothetical protein Q9181_005933, partial [Wetmoreana brouardii]
WYFKTGPSDGEIPRAPCHMAFYIPDIDGAAGKPPQRDNDQCTRIFHSMVQAARNVSWDAPGPDSDLNPGSPPSPIKLPGGAGTGNGRGLVAALHGPAGTGKTLTAEGIAEMLKNPFYADVFLEQRESHDISRNALVSIFLRMSEYFQGILFLTTNRVIKNAVRTAQSIALIENEKLSMTHLPKVLLVGEAFAKD